VFGLIPRHWRLGCLAVVGALVALPASTALADGGSATHPNITITFKAKHHWHITVSAYGCGAKGSTVSVSANKSATHYSFGHYYNGPAKKSGCSGSTKLNSGKMHAYWGRLFRMKMSVKGAGSLVKIPTPSTPGCTGYFGHQRAIKAHGTLRMLIHKHVLGHISLTHAKGLMEIFNGDYKCGSGGGGGHPVKATFANGQFGTNFLSATKYDKTGNTQVFVSGPDKPGPKVFGGFSDVFFNAPFTFNHDLTSATIGSVTGFMSGSVSFTGTSQCVPGWENGTWNSGTLKVHDGLSKQSYVGSATAFGQVYKSNASCYG
jgi:hypothetical protein